MSECGIGNSRSPGKAIETPTTVVEEQLKNGQLQVVEKVNAKSEVWTHNWCC